MMEKGKPLSPQFEAVFDAAYEREQQKKSIDEISRQIHERIRFKLMGYDTNGDSAEWSIDAGRIQDIEKKLVVNPQELKREFQLLRQHWNELKDDEGKLNTFLIDNTKFGKSGGHSRSNSKKTLYRVRREGWAIMAGISLPDDDFYPLAYNYGFDTMPENDEMLHVLSRSTLNRPDEVADRSKVAFNWRSGVAESVDSSILRKAGIHVPEGKDAVSLRRIGIASAVKFIMVRLNQMHAKEQIWFNIGTIYDVDGSPAKIRNVPSFEHNRRIFAEDHGYRMHDTDIAITGSRGEYEIVGTMHWRARSDKVLPAIQKLRSENGVLAARGWNTEDLERVAVIIHDQIEKEKHQIGPSGMTVHV